jgi:hypothetical protein
METQKDIYGLDVTRTVEGTVEIYVRADGVRAEFPVNTGWGHALYVFNSMLPMNVGV